MRMFLISVALLGSSPVLANDTVASTPATTAASTPVTAEAVKEEKKICKRIDATESRLAAKRVCLTQEQWKKKQSEQM